MQAQSVTSDTSTKNGYYKRRPMHEGLHDGRRLDWIVPAPAGYVCALYWYDSEQSTTQVFSSLDEALQEHGYTSDGFVQNYESVECPVTLPKYSVVVTDDHEREFDVLAAPLHDLRQAALLLQGMMEAPEYRSFQAHIRLRDDRSEKLIPMCGPSEKKKDIVLRPRPALLLVRSDQLPSWVVVTSVGAMALLDTNGAEKRFASLDQLREHYALPNEDLDVVEDPKLPTYSLVRRAKSSLGYEVAEEGFHSRVYAEAIARAMTAKGAGAILIRIDHTGELYDGSDNNRQPKGAFPSAADSGASAGDADVNALVDAHFAGLNAVVARVCAGDVRIRDIALVLVDRRDGAFRALVRQLAAPVSEQPVVLLVIRRDQLKHFVAQLHSGLRLGLDHPLDQPIAEDRVWLAVLSGGTVRLLHIHPQSVAPSDMPPGDDLGVAVLLGVSFGDGCN
jgi:hypothetical protein